jgi:hypothetical protein
MFLTCPSNNSRQTRQNTALQAPYLSNKSKTGRFLKNPCLDHQQTTTDPQPATSNQQPAIIIIAPNFHHKTMPRFVTPKIKITRKFPRLFHTGLSIAPPESCRNNSRQTS